MGGNRRTEPERAREPGGPAMPPRHGALPGCDGQLPLTPDAPAWGLCYNALAVRRPLFVQPRSEGRLSGGYLYNARMAEHGAWELRDVQASELSTLASRHDVRRALLVDSLWLTPAHLSPFLDLAARGGRVGVMLHAFPSMIATAESGALPAREPSPFELDAVERLGLCLVPGRYYADLLAPTRARVQVAEPGIDEIWRAEPRRREGPCKMLSVGAVTPLKGFLDVAEALSQRTLRDYTWTVIGSLDADLAYAACLHEHARRNGAIELTGQLPPAQVARRVRGADLLVMPSYTENQPLVLLEAIAASVPVVAYAAGAAPQMLEHEREGLIAPIGDKSRLAAYLAQLLDDEPTRHAMALRCAERQRTLPDWAHAAARARWAVERELSEFRSRS